MAGCLPARTRRNATPARSPARAGIGAHGAEPVPHPVYARCPMDPTVWLIIPTYNEASNLERIVRASLVELERVVPGDHRVLVVDDSSPDGTGAIADALAKELGTVEVLHRPGKAGLRSGLRRGIHACAAGRRAAGDRDGR